MSSTPTTLTREQWRTVLDDTDLPTFGELVSTIEAATMIDAEGPAAEQLVDGAVGDLLEADRVDGHAAGLNLQCSFWLTPETAYQLYRELAALLLRPGADNE